MEALLRDFRATVEALSKSSHSGFVGAYPRVLVVDAIASENVMPVIGEDAGSVFDCTDGYSLHSVSCGATCPMNDALHSLATCNRHSEQGSITPFEVQQAFSRHSACADLVLQSLSHNAHALPCPLLLTLHGMDRLDYDVHGEHTLPAALRQALDWAMCVECWLAARGRYGDGPAFPLPPRTALLLCVDATLLPPWLALPPRWRAVQQGTLLLGLQGQHASTAASPAAMPVSLWLRCEEGAAPLSGVPAPAGRGGGGGGGGQERQQHWEGWLGYEGLKEDLLERVVRPIKAHNNHSDPSLLPLAQAMSALHVRPPSGLLLYGPTGTGKTQAAKEIAKAAGCTLLHVVCARLLSRYVGDSEAGIRRLFAAARALSPCVLLLDGIEAIAGARQGMEQAVGEGRGVAASKETMLDRLVATLLAEMDGVGHIQGEQQGARTGRTGSTVCVIGTCTAPTGGALALDAALMRPGRLELSFCVPYPPASEVGQLCEAWCHEWQGEGRPRVQVQEGLWAEIARSIAFPAWTLPSIRQLVHESILQAIVEQRIGQGVGVGEGSIALEARHVHKAAKEISFELAIEKPQDS